MLLYLFAGGIEAGAVGQEDVEDACRHHGWTGPINYDGEQEDWLW